MVVWLEVEVQLWWCGWKLKYSYGGVVGSCSTVMVVWLEVEVQLWWCGWKLKYSYGCVVGS